MGDKSNTNDAESSDSTKNKSLHPAYSVTNIQTKIRTLDGTTTTYSSWTKLFKLNAKAYNVLSHIEEDATPEPTSDEFKEWSQLDSLVLQWIYSTVSNTILERIIDSNTTARATWLKLEGIYLNNKRARAAALEHKFSNLLLTACKSMEDYFQQLKDFANQLGDVGHPVSEERLVLQLVRGLPREYDVVGAIINQSTPTWDEALTQINLEQQRQEARQQMQSAMMATGDRSPQYRNYQGNNNYNQRSNFPNANRGGRAYGQYQYRGRGRSQRGRGRGSLNSNGWAQNNSAMNNNSWPNNSWQPPPSPYPTQQTNNSSQQWGAPNWNNNASWSGSSSRHNNYRSIPQQSNVQTQGPNFQPTAPTGQNPNPNYEFAGFSESNANELAQAMGQINLNTMGQTNTNAMDPAWYMDSGASSHLTPDPGFQDWSQAFPPR